MYTFAGTHCNRFDCLTAIIGLFNCNIFFDCNNHNFDHRFDTIHSTLPARVSAHIPQFSWSPSPYFLSDLVDKDKFISNKFVLVTI